MRLRQESGGLGATQLFLPSSTARQPEPGYGARYCCTNTSRRPWTFAGSAVSSVAEAVPSSPALCRALFATARDRTVNTSVVMASSSPWSTWMDVPQPRAAAPHDVHGRGADLRGSARPAHLREPRVEPEPGGGADRPPPPFREDHRVPRPYAHGTKTPQACSNALDHHQGDVIELGGHPPRTVVRPQGSWSGSHPVPR